MVLVADDDLDERMLFRRLLEREGFQVEEATDGQMALDRARELRPDLILMDVQMPRVDGFTAVERLRHDVRTARIPIIVVTAAARKPADVARGLGLGADDYLSKPFSVEEFVARASSKIRARRLEEKLRRRTEELEALVRIGSELNEALALEDLADRILAAILEQIPAASALLVLVGGPERPPLQRLLGGDSHDSDLMAPDTLPGYVLECGEAVLIVDAIGDKRVRAIINGAKCRAGMATPLRHHGQILGVLALGDPAPGCFTPGNLRLLRSIGEQAALALRNAQLYTQLQEYAQDLESKVEARTAALQSAQLHLMRAEKMAALGTLAAGIAHEVNNPLQPILTNLEMALEDVQEKRPIDVELLEFAKQDVQRIQRIVSRLLDFARPTQREPILVDVNEIAAEVLRLAGKQLEHARVAVKTKYDATRHIVGSPDQLKQVILNLFVNAMEAMPNGGTLTISTEDQNGFVALAVRDTGFGIPADKLSQVFDPFFTTKPGGTGLGLAVSYGIIEGHGGKILVESKQGEYTEIMLRLPMRSGD